MSEMKDCGPLFPDGAHQCVARGKIVVLLDKAPSKQAPKKHSHYFREWMGVRIDFYFVMALFGITDQSIGHAIKKLMFAGVRGAKDEARDLNEAIDSIKRRLELIELFKENERLQKETPKP